MTTLSEWIKRDHPSVRFPVPSEPRQVVQAAAKIRHSWPNVTSEDPDADPEVLALEMDRRRKSDDWRGFYWMDATSTAVTFLGSQLWQERRFSKLFDFMVRQIGSDRNLSYTLAVFRKYLETFKPRSELTDRLANVLKKNWRQGTLPVGQWVEDFHIFDTRHAPREIAKFMISQEKPYQALRQSGLEVPHGEGLMQEAHLCFISDLKPRIRSSEFGAILKLLDWLKPMGVKHPLQGTGAGKAIDTLLMPWNRREPESSHKDIIKSRLVDAYGDPRVNSAGAWSSCSEISRNVIMRWITGTTIKMFFDIVTEAERSHMWHNRKDLWIDLYEEGHITEAWFALSEEGAVIARRLTDASQDTQLSFGRNKSRDGQDRHKCLLLMKVDDRWVVEGSHNFKTHVFSRRDDVSVAPYQESYTCEQFRSHRGSREPQRFPHYANWRDKVTAALLK